MSETWRALVFDLRALVAAEVRQAQSSSRLDNPTHITDIQHWVRAARSAVGAWSRRPEVDDAHTTIPFTEHEFANVIRGCSWDAAIPLLTTFSLLECVPFWSILRWEQLDSPILPTSFVKDAIIGRQTALANGETGFAALAALRGNHRDGILIKDGFSDLRRAHSLVDQIAGLRNNLFIPLYSRDAERLILAIIVISLPIADILPRSLIRSAALVCERSAELYHVKYREALSNDRVELSRRFQRQSRQLLSTDVAAALAGDAVLDGAVKSALVPMATSFTIRRPCEGRTPRISKSTTIIAREHDGRLSAERAELRFFTGRAALSEHESWHPLAYENRAGLQLWVRSTHPINLGSATTLLIWLSETYRQLMNHYDVHALHSAVDVIREIASQALDYVVLGESRLLERCLLSYDFALAIRNIETEISGAPRQILTRMRGEWPESTDATALVLTIQECGVGWDANNIQIQDTAAYLAQFRTSFSYSNQATEWTRRLRAEFCSFQPVLAWTRVMTTWAHVAINENEHSPDNSPKTKSFSGQDFCSLLLEDTRHVNVTVDKSTVIVEVEADWGPLTGRFIRYDRARCPMAWAGVRARVTVEKEQTGVEEIKMPAASVVLLDSQCDKAFYDVSGTGQYDPLDASAQSWKALSTRPSDWLRRLLRDRSPAMLDDVDMTVFASFNPGADPARQLFLNGIFEGTADAVLMAAGVLRDVRAPVEDDEAMPRTILGDRLKHLLEVAQKEAALRDAKEAGGITNFMLSDLLHDFKDNAVKSLRESLDQLETVDPGVSLLVESLFTYFLLRTQSKVSANRRIEPSDLLRWFRKAQASSEQRAQSKSHQLADVKCHIQAPNEERELDEAPELVGTRLASNLLGNALAAASEFSVVTGSPTTVCISVNRNVLEITNDAKLEHAAAIMTALNDRESNRVGDQVTGVNVLLLAADLLGLELQASMNRIQFGATLTIQVETEVTTHLHP